MNMLKKLAGLMLMALMVLIFTNCGSKNNANNNLDTLKTDNMQNKVDKYAKFKLEGDMKNLTEDEKKVLPILLEVAKLMDDIYWEETYGNKEEFLSKLNDESMKQFAMINYGPWDRLDGDKPFIEGYGAKPAGANFYPKDMTKEEFEKLNDKEKNSEYTIIRRDENGVLKVIPYREAFKEKIEKAAELMKQAAEISKDKAFSNYLKLRAEALLTDKYYESDMAWMDVKNSNIDFIVGPIENYEDGLFGLKTAHESFILLKDKEWSSKLAKFSKMLPELQKALPVEDKYKKEIPGTDSDINAYDALYYAGDCNSGSKTIAINLPNDERIHVKKGTRKLQLKNSMRAKFEKILVPISDIVIDKEQKKHIKFNAFFENTMFHEVAHAMGIKNTINGKGTVRKALKETYSIIEEGKADILGLYLVTKLYEKGELKDGELMDNYVTFVAGIIRSVRFGVSSSHGKANMETFNFMMEQGAFTRNEYGIYKVNFEKMKEAITLLTQKILKLQGEGEYETVKKNIEKDGVVKTELSEDLKKISDANIPVDIVFEQGNF